MAGIPYENRNFVPLFPENEVRNQKYAGIYETNQKALGQADAEKRSDLFRVHLLRRRGLIERNYRTPKTPD
jgi:hypothetical protein